MYYFKDNKRKYRKKYTGNLDEIAEDKETNQLMNEEYQKDLDELYSVQSITSKVYLQFMALK